MDLESIELSRERAVSSEPCSTRPNPFDNDTPSSRKRQRISSAGSRSRSVDAARVSMVRLSATPEEADGELRQDPHLPQTPTRNTSTRPVAEPTSSRVTINLRSTRPVESSSSVPPSPETPSKMAGQIEGTQMSTDSGDENFSIKPPIGTPSSTSSNPADSGSPEIELISVNEDDSEFGNRSPPVAIIDDDDEPVMDSDPMSDFPYRTTPETLPSTVRKIVRFLEFDAVESEEPFCRLRDWIESFLQHPISREGSAFDAYMNDCEFWEIFPEIVWALSRRRNFFGQFLIRNKEGRRALSDFLCQFARLTARFLTMDVRTLSRSSGLRESAPEPTVASRPYLHAFGWLLRKDEAPHIGRNLEAHYRWNWNEDVSMQMTTFLTTGGSIQHLTRFVQGLLLHMHRFPKLIVDMTEPSRIVNRAVTEAASVLNDPDGSHRQYIETYEEIIALGFQFYKTMSSGLISIIEKHVTSFTPDAALAHVTGLTNVLYCSMTFSGCPAHEILDDHRLKHPTLPHVFSAMVISNEWKFEILRKLIVSGQMQLRVIGVTHMCADLLGMFTKNKKDDPTSHPVLLHFAEFILQNKLVDYIVGIASHPEIIVESYNIVGFLIATKTYTTQQTDTIWQTVMTSQDPRVVEAILRMLGQIINLYDYESLLYLCKKVEELPLEAFTVVMRDYCERLLNQLVQKASIERLHSIDAPPYELCVRLIRESSVPRPETPMGSLDIQLFASKTLRDLIAHGPEAEVRNGIYVSCIEDISKRTYTAPGSICALYGLLRQNLAIDLHVLTTNHGLTRLMIEELELTNNGSQDRPVSSTANSPARQARKDILLAIITYEPSTITAKLGERLWNLLVGRDARSGPNREIGWQILNDAAKKSPSNSFITTCFKTHLPKLDPECYTVGSLDFARASIVAWLSEAKGDLLDDEQLSKQSGVEQLWRMVLMAPPNTIETPAVNMLVELYIESSMISSMSRTRAHSLHLTLVTRCLSQLSSAATKLKEFGEADTNEDDESMVIIASMDQVHEQELIFTRSLIILREFLRSYQSKPYYMLSKPRSPALNLTNEVIGDTLIIKYQIFDGEKRGEIKELSLGTQNTVATLFTTLHKVTGFKGCKVYHWGKEINVEETDLYATLEELKIGKGLLLVVRNDDSENVLGSLQNRSSTLENEIIKHFDELWGYLGMEEKLAREIYYFLIKFPVYIKLLIAFEDDATSCTDIFPLGKPFKCLYAIYALREHLASQSQQGDAKYATLSKSMELLVSAITTKDVLDSCASEELRNYLTLHLSECLTQLLRDPIPEESLSTLGGTLLNRLLELLYLAKDTVTMQNSVPLVASIFDAVLEASFHSPQFWKAFTTHPQTPQLLRELLLNEPRATLRKNILKLVTNKCCYTPSLSSLSTTDFSMEIWPLLNDLVSEAVKQPEKCEEVMTVALLVFRKLADTSIESVDVEGCLLKWGQLLVEHESHEEVGHLENVDVVSRGLANLLYWCVSFAKASQRPLPPNTLADKIFTKHLFPDLSISEDDDSAIIESLPLLNTASRRLMTDTIIFLTKDDRDQYQQIIEHLGSLVPHNPVDENPYVVDLSFVFDRSKAIRSSTGYVGLRNLSNTCYLNSLFTQLFMNVSFRRFMLNAYVADGGAAQKLLYETQKLFAFMQNSLKRYIDPTQLAASIRTYDDTVIDVSIQMDVDEFYNLLFDRWESQILSSSDKREFRSYYGGQLVQQVKSKECSHISERLEPFSAIQCDIKGKTSLQESLQAYVDGEVMEGDNKYKCSSCDRHVNAVKRACLKDIPDNLIFHLKRFDFNLRAMQRSKINDYFSFPLRIDMRPYKVEYLMKSPDETQEDIYELVGILVHAGTAESGHYYSYIRERPSCTQPPNWVEFNDDTVSSFDPASIEANCFGGPDYRGPEGGTSFQFDKSYSAYMLFYQRSTVLQAQQTDIHPGTTGPIRLELARNIGNYIAQENESLIRKYCLYDEGHAPFVLRMLDNIQHINKGRCSADHILERIALNTTLNHLDQVVARTKDLPDLANYMLALHHRFQACPECSRDFLDWVIAHFEALRHLLFRNPDQTVRNETASAIIHTLTKVKHDCTYPCYGLYDDSYEHEEDGETDWGNPRLFVKIVIQLRKLWDTFHLHTKAWPEYFGLLVNVAQIGRLEAAILLDHSFLRRALEVVCADPALPQHPQYSRMLTIISKRPVSKPASYGNIIALIEVLLKSCDLNAESIGDNDFRYDLILHEQPMPLSQSENSSLSQHWTKGTISILVDKLLLLNQNERSTQAIIAMLLRGSNHYHHVTFNAIRAGIQKVNNTSIPVAPFLRGALTLIENTESEKAMENMLGHIINVTRVLDSAEGRDYLRFFKHLSEIPSIRVNVEKENFDIYVTEQIPQWAPSLLTYYDAVVRTDTEDFVQQMVLRYATETSLETSSEAQQKSKLMTEVARNLGLSCLKYLHDEHVQPRVQAVRATLFSINAIIEQCKLLYDETGGDELDVQFYQYFNSVIPALRKLTVEVAEDEISEWENSDDAFSSSEVMESVTELGPDGLHHDVSEL